MQAARSMWLTCTAFSILAPCTLPGRSQHAARGPSASPAPPTPGCEATWDSALKHILEKALWGLYPGSLQGCQKNTLAAICSQGHPCWVGLPHGSGLFGAPRAARRLYLGLPTDRVPPFPWAWGHLLVPNTGCPQP